MKTSDLQDQIAQIAEPIAMALNLELIEVLCQGRGAGMMVLVTLDKEGGIGIKECEGFHKSFSHALDVADLIPHAYRLEVSSPGLDRPLKQLKDYRRVLGKLLRVKVHEPNGGVGLRIGTLEFADEKGLRLVLKPVKGIQHEEFFTWDQVAGGKQEIEF